MTFHVGQKVICVEDADYKFGDYEEACKGRIYTIRRIETRYHLKRGNIDCLLLNEIRNREEWAKCGPRVKIEPSFGAYRFRPVTERNTDISIFKKMLTDAPNDCEHAE